MDPTAASDPIEELIHDVAADALRFFALVAAVLGFATGGLLVVAMAMFQADRAYLMPPAWFACAGGAFGVLIRLIAPRRLLSGVAGRALLLLIASSPSIFFAAAELSGPAGCAPYLTGPFAFLYLFCIVITGCALEPRLSVAAGALVALQYAGFYAIARDRLQHMTIDAMLGRDLLLDVVWVNRFAVVFCTGLATAGMAVVARRLARRVRAAGAAPPVAAPPPS